MSGHPRIYRYLTNLAHLEAEDGRSLCGLLPQRWGWMGGRGASEGERESAELRPLCEDCRRRA